MSNFNEYIASEYGDLVGKKIKTVRPLLPQELEMFGWEEEGRGGVAMVIFFTDGSALIPSQDPEGNGAGHLIYSKK
jgi:hypothetical protein